MLSQNISSLPILSLSLGLSRGESERGDGAFRRRSTARPPPLLLPLAPSISPDVGRARRPPQPPSGASARVRHVAVPAAQHVVVSAARGDHL